MGHRAVCLVAKAVAHKLNVGEPEVVINHSELPSFGSLNHIRDALGIPFLEPELEIGTHTRILRLLRSI